MIIKSLLDTDFYKFSMGQLIFHQFPQRTAKFRFLCRNKNIDLTPYQEEITQELKNLCQLRFKEDELNYLKSLGLFKDDYLNYLRNFKLNFDDLTISAQDGKLVIEAEGVWANITFFELYTLSIVNEVYFRNQKDIDESVGISRLQDKVSLIREVNLKAENSGQQLFKLSDFGTRRRFSASWQEKVDNYLNCHLNNFGFMGTSSVYIAYKLGLNPIGTFAHELLSAHQVISPELIDSQKLTFENWYKEYQGQLGIALSDIYGLKPFLKDFDLRLASLYQGARHDSGDPVKWGEALIAHYQNLGINPLTKTLVFSDGLNVPLAIELYHHFKERINVVFGIGTNLTNDFNVPALNIVMKMVSLDGRAVCKISDEPSKAICDDPTFLQQVKDTFGVE